MTTTLYDLPISHYCVKVKKILDYKGIPYRTVDAPYHNRQELLRVSGQDYVPYLVDEGKGIAWADIPDYLERKAPTPTLYPNGNKGKTKIIEHWAHAVVEEAVWRYVVTDARKWFESRSVEEAWVFEEMQTRARGPWHVLELRKGEFHEGMKSTLALVQAGLDGESFYGGDAPSLADFALYGAISPLYTVGRSIPEEFRELRAWWGRLEKKA